MSRSKQVLIGIGGLLVIAILAGALWMVAVPTIRSLAQSPTATAPGTIYPAPGNGSNQGSGAGQSTTPGANSGSSFKDQMAKYEQFFLSALASKLGITTDQLTAAFNSAYSDTLDQAVKDGLLTADQATQLKSNAANNQSGLGLPFAFFGHRGFKMFGDQNNPQAAPGTNGEWGMPGMRGGFGFGGRGGFFGFHGMMGGMGLDAFAKALNMNLSDLQTALQNGQSIADIAKSQNIDLATVKTSVLASLKSNLDQAVSAGNLTQAQADQIYNQAGTVFDTFVNQTWSMPNTQNQQPGQQQSFPTQ